MARESAIGWTDATFNPWHGCEKVSPACAHCYAETSSNRWGHTGLWGAGHGFRFFGDKHWDEPLKWARDLPEQLGRRPRVFTASMADVFEERPELDEHRQRLFALIEATPEMDWLVLTKRPEFARDWLGSYFSDLATPGDYTLPIEPFPNVWLGVSIENARFTWRADVLREIPAAVRFISAEPLLGSLFTIDCRECGGTGMIANRTGANEWEPVQCRRCFHKRPLDLDGIDWVIAGGESGPGHRPTKIEWLRELRDACLVHDLDNLVERPAFFFKQWGGKTPTAGGKLLDGMEWAEFPQSAGLVAAL